MGIVNNALLLEKGLRADFLKAFNNGENPADVMQFIMKTTSNSNQEKYGWLGEVSGMTEWTDERTLRGLNDYDYTLANKDYEATLKVDRNALQDDQLGAVKLRVADLALKARVSFPRKLFFDQIALGSTELCYDGVPFFSASHPESGDNQSNLLSGTASSTYTLAEFVADFEAARAALRGFKDDQGDPRNEGELDLMIVAPQGLENYVDKVISADLISNTTNTLKGAAKKLISARLPGDQDWYLADVSGAIKPFIMQERSAITFEAQEKGERAFMRKEYLYGVDQRVGFGFGLWSKMVKINN